MSTVVLYATDTMADWEYAYVTAGLTMAEQQAPGRFALRVAGTSAEPVRTLGRLRLTPDSRLADLDEPDIALLLLPGGDTWGEGHEEVLALAGRLLERGVSVGGICGATLGLARAGLLDARRHTSNAPEFLAQSGYAGAGRYEEARVVVDGPLVTAPGTAPLEFAKAVFEAVELFPQPVIDAWYGLYSTGEKRYYEALMGGAE